jgi:beta-mannosidase
MEPIPGTEFAYRIPLMTSQVERIFKKASDSLEAYALQSQISQAEAKKYFIERFRIGKWRRTGIIWWNVIDGWPQISDAVVDWYGCKKLAYHYIKTSQLPFCMMVDEPENGMLTLCAANDTRTNKTIRYTVTNLATGEDVLKGDRTVPPDTTVRVAKFAEEAGACYVIRWEGDENGRNHFTAAIGDGIDLSTYSEWMKSLGYWELLDGFENT